MLRTAGTLNIRTSESSRLGIPSRLADRLLQSHTPIDYAKGAVIFIENSSADLFFLLQSGAVAISSATSSDSRFITRLASPGDIFGDLGVPDPEKHRVRSVEAVAFTKCSIVPITRAHVNHIREQLTPEELIQSFEDAQTMWAQTYGAMVRFLNLTFRERIETVLKDLVARFGIPESRGTLIPLDLSHDIFAELIGSSRPMATKLISELVEENTLERDGRRYILRAAAELTSATEPARYGLRQNASTISAYSNSPRKL